MRSSTVAFASAILVSVLGLAQSGLIGDVPRDQVESYSLIIDPIIKAILESMRPKLANLTFDDIHQTIENPNLNGTVNLDHMVITNADQFEIQNLKSTLLPLRLTNLTLTWNNISAGARYDIDTTLVIPELKRPIRLFAKGEASALLKNLFFTIGANVETKGHTIQIKPRGLFGFDIKLESTKVTLSGLMGNAELGNAIGAFISKSIPELVNTLKKPLFDAFQDDIIAVINEFLKKNGSSLFSDEFQDVQEPSSDSVGLFGEIDPFFGQPLDLGADLGDDEFNFNF